jgi:hypothetical protein
VTRDREALAGERVRLRSLAHQDLATVHTRPDGSFHVPWVPPGVYFLAIGAPNVTSISLREGQSLDAGTLAVVGY